MKTFGTTNLSELNVTICPLVRANSLDFWKKAISFRMPDCLHGWRTGTNDGNPTKLAEVNDFIKRVKKLEARKQGVEFQTCQPMLEIEFQRLHEVFKLHGKEHNSAIWWYGIQFCLCNF